MRPIDADALKKDLSENYTFYGFRQLMNDFYEALDSAPTIDAVSEWIPCSERLPSEFSDDERVLATTDVDGLGVILMPAYDVKSWYLKGYISAWMPLPKPYGERKGE